jgi:hypothetical protein
MANIKITPKIILLFLILMSLASSLRLKVEQNETPVDNGNQGQISSDTPASAVPGKAYSRALNSPF